MTYKTEFPAFASAIPPVFLAPPWVDVSWCNDATPSFMRPIGSGRELHIYVDELDNVLRWDGGETPRFSIHLTDENGSFVDTGPCFMSDDLEAVLAQVDLLMGEIVR